MHYIFGMLRPLQINHICDNFRPHGMHGLYRKAPYYFASILAAKEFPSCPVFTLNAVRQQPHREKTAVGDAACA